jgi:hypothetical protein
MRKVCPCPLSLSKILGTPSLTLEGWDTFIAVVTNGGESRGVGVNLLAASWLLIMAINLFNVSFMAQVVSACSLSLFSIYWNLSSSMARELTTFRDCYQGGTGDNRW